MRHLCAFVAFAVAACAAWGQQRESRGPASSLEDAGLAGADRGVLVPGNGSDACAGAVGISGYSSWAFDLAGATTDGLGHGQCLLASSDQLWRDRWWDWTAPASGIVRVETCGQTTLDTRIAVYAPASPCPPTDEYLVICNDDSCGLQSSLTFVARAGQTYRIRIGRYGLTEPAAAGSGTFTIFSNNAPDICPDDAGPCQNPIPNGIAYTSNASFRVADNFSPSSSGAMEGLCWWGSYIGLAPGADSFVVTYWTSSGGLPALPIASFSQGAGLAVQRVDSTLANNVGDTMFLYSATHAQVPLASGVNYWVEVRNMFGGTWYWQESQQGDGSIQDFSPPSNWAGATARPNVAWCAQFQSGCAFDTNGDGVLNFADLNNIISSFNTNCP